VGGWLTVLCLMLTVIGPAISVWLMAHDYRALTAHAPFSAGAHAAALASLALSGAAIAYGVWAGLLLWRVRPLAVDTAKRALLFGLVVDVLTTANVLAGAPVSPQGAQFINQLMAHAAPSLVFFTLSFAYLNRSRRVAATYRAGDAQAGAPVSG
jgi:hypothetical protein